MCAVTTRTIVYLPAAGKKAALLSGPACLRILTAQRQARWPFYSNRRLAAKRFISFGAKVVGLPSIVTVRGATQSVLRR